MKTIVHIQFLSVSVLFAMWLFVVLNGVEYEVTVLIRTRSLIAFLRQNCSLWQNLFVYEPFQSQAAIERWQSQHLPTSPYLRIHTSPSFLPSLLFPSFSFSFSFSHCLPPSLHFLLPMDSHRNVRLQTFARIRDERFYAHAQLQTNICWNQRIYQITAVVSCIHP